MDKEIFEILKKDSEKELESIIKKKSVDINTVLNSEQLKSAISDFSKYEMLQNNPPILCCSAYLRAENCFSLLLNLKAKIDCFDFYHTPLTFFAVIGNSTKILDKILNLIKTSQTTLSFRNSIFCALEYSNKNSKDFELAGWLYSYNFFRATDVDFRGFSLIKCAIEFNRVDFLRFFIEVAKCQLTNSKFSPLCFAFEKKAIDCLNYILDISTSKSKYSQSFTSLPTILNNQNSKIFIDINQCDDNKNTPIHWAAKYGSVEIVRKILEFEDVLVCTKNSQGKLPLDLAENEEIRQLISQRAEVSKNLEEKIEKDKEKINAINEKNTRSQIIPGQNCKKIVNDHMMAKNVSTSCILI